MSSEVPVVAASLSATEDPTDEGEGQGTANAEEVENLLGCGGGDQTCRLLGRHL